ncbi:MAG TPA: toll/interleukin-1 receptor domain-containing protein, partial [Steroidobacteraceae bacterium]|nr:toll/interleukin-1 receptor domain-containing protein [Steroidobacteraceae bacterium]
VFISHSSADDAFCQRLTADLRAALPPNEAGRERVWYDHAPQRGQEDAADTGGVLEPGGLTIGMDYPTEIAEQIAARTVIVVVLSPEAARSRWVKDELSQSKQRYNGSERVLICPLVYRECATPTIISNFQTLDFRGVDDDVARYQRQVDELVARVRDGRWPLSESAPPFELGVLPEPAELVGRDEELGWVLGRLRAGGATAITALGGMGGIGKSALAAAAMRRLRVEGAFPDGMAVVLCEDQTDPVEVVRQALSRFMPGRRTPDASDLPGLAAAAQTLLAGKRALIVLDNIEPGWPVEQVTRALTATPVTLLLTARQTLPTDAVPPGAARQLDLLSPAAALLLFAQSYGRATVEALSAEERSAAERIVALVDRHTLAVRLAGAWPAELRRPLAAVADELARDLLAAPDGETARKVEIVLNSSVVKLDAEARLLFAALAGFGAGEFGRKAALALAAALGLSDPAPTLGLLTRRALLDASYDAALAAYPKADAERLRLHPLLRAYARDLYDARRAVVDDPPWTDERRADVERAIAAWYADYTNTAPDLALIPDETNITGALDWALASGDDRAAARIC